MASGCCAAQHSVKTSVQDAAHSPAQRAYFSLPCDDVYRSLLSQSKENSPESTCNADHSPYLSVTNLFQEPVKKVQHQVLLDMTFYLRMFSLRTHEPNPIS